MTSSETRAEVIRRHAQAAGLAVVEEVVLPGQDARLLPLPSGLYPTLAVQLHARFSGGIYSHQAKALLTLAREEDVCLATPTASGKSLVFLTHAADLLLKDDSARVLAFYPAKALIRDQMDKWKELLEPLGLPVGFIDGSVSTGMRADILNRSRVVLMTPDVAHAWLMSNLAHPSVRSLLARLRLLVLDEAHVYEGVFGTNMSYLLRRFQAVAAPHRLVCSTATIDDPQGFIHALTGRDVVIFDSEDNGAAVTRKAVISVRPVEAKRFDAVVNLVRELGREYAGRFLVFADSRRMVELVVASLARDKEKGPTEGQEASRDLEDVEGVLPYRAGYEEDDRARIQQALQEGALKGVVSTSALELGLDIGAIDLVVLLGVPPTMKALWQRIGRAGRRNEGTCLMLDDAGDVGTVSRGLSAYLQRPLEPSWLYLGNRYIQYAQAMCMAIEVQSWAGEHNSAVLDTVPDTFRSMLDNELDPTEMIAADLYPLKQLAQGDPHHQFPLRSGIEPSLKVSGPFIALGSLSWSQVLREAYPGAVYYYMAKPYRITSVQQRRQLIRAKREKRYFTSPVSQVMVFPSFQDPMALWTSGDGFVAEVPMQVSERTMGFRERRGGLRIDHRYGPDSTWSQRELTRFFETTGVCWYFSQPELLTEPVAQALLEAFSLRYGVQRSDLGVGPFFSKQAPGCVGRCRGICIYDATHGSLRLTQRLATELSEVAHTALSQANDDESLLGCLESLASALEYLKPAEPETQGVQRALGDDIVEVVAPDQQAMHVTGAVTRQVRVLAWRYTPYGLMYQIEGAAPGVKEMVPVQAIQPLLGETRMVRVNLVTGEEDAE